MNDQALRVQNAHAAAEQSDFTQPQKEIKSGIFAKSRSDGSGWGLILASFDGQLRPVSLTDGATVGTASKDTPIEGAGIAPEHVRVMVRADGCYLEDLETPQGTYVNGVQARRMELRQGDVVRLGQTLGIFVDNDLTSYAGHTLRTGSLIHGPRQTKTWIEPILELVKSGSSVCIEGEPGTGKRSMARLAATFRDSAGGVVVVDGSANGKPLIPPGARPMTWVVLEADRIPRAQQLEIAHAVGRSIGVIVIATVSQPVDRAVADGKLAPWFGSMFSGKRVTVTPLESRREDLPSIIRDIAERKGIALDRIGPELLDALVRAGWPGGIPQIEATLVAAAQATDASKPIELAAVISSLSRASRAKPTLPHVADPALARARLEDALARTNGSVASAARSLGMSRQAIYREAERLGLDIARRKSARS